MVMISYDPTGTGAGSAPDHQEIIIVKMNHFTVWVLNHHEEDLNICSFMLIQLKV